MDRGAAPRYGAIVPKLLDDPQVPALLALLEKSYPDVTCALTHHNPFQLVAATILSAQCTDKRVNLVTPALFARYSTPQAMAAADPLELEAIIRSTGFFRNKTKSLIGMASALVTRHQGQVPRTMQELTALPGVARKTANVVLGTAFGIADGVVVDTHVARLSRLIGLTRESDPVKIERDLMQRIPKAAWINFGHQLIHHGRQVCIANRPRCDACALNQLCVSAFAVAGKTRRAVSHAGRSPTRRRRGRQGR